MSFQWSDSPNLWSLPVEYLSSVLVDRLGNEEHQPTYFAMRQEVGTFPAGIIEWLGEEWRVDLHATLHNGSQRLVATHKTLPVHLGINHERNAAVIDAQVVSFTSITEAEQMLTDLFARVTPLKSVPPKNTIRVRFWMYGAMGPSSYNRLLPTQFSWKQAKANYNEATASALSEVMAWRKHPPEGGRLLLLHGPPGTGKTHAIRTLAREWGAWCNVHYVIDPDAFFSNASYMLQVLMEQQGSSGGEDDECVSFDDMSQPARPKAARRWNLVVVEDADELLTVDAKRRTGQGMARLLNICDGLIGQGLDIMVLITTNEPVDNLHPAITRPGRCLANITVDMLSVGEANAWLTARGCDARVTEPTPLAVLYEKVRQQTTHVATSDPQKSPGGYL